MNIDDLQRFSVYPANGLVVVECTKCGQTIWCVTTDMSLADVANTALDHYDDCPESAGRVFEDGEDGR